MSFWVTHCCSQAWILLNFSVQGLSMQSDALVIHSESDDDVTVVAAPPVKKLKLNSGSMADVTRLSDDEPDAGETRLRRRRAAQSREKRQQAVNVTQLRAQVARVVSGTCKRRGQTKNGCKHNCFLQFRRKQSDVVDLCKRLRSLSKQDMDKEATRC